MLERKAHPFCVTAALPPAYVPTSISNVDHSKGLSLVDASSIWLTALVNSRSCGVNLVTVVPRVSLLAPKKLVDESLTLPPFGHSTFDINL